MVPICRDHSPLSSRTEQTSDLFTTRYFSVNFPPTLGNLMLELDQDGNLLEYRIPHTAKCATFTLVDGNIVWRRKRNAPGVVRGGGCPKEIGQLLPADPSASPSRAAPSSRARWIAKCSTTHQRTLLPRDFRFLASGHSTSWEAGRARGLETKGDITTGPWQTRS